MKMRVISGICLGLMMFSDAQAQEIWNIESLDAKSFPSEIVVEERQTADDGIPDGLIETYSGAGDIVSAWYSVPTERYNHAILGDGIEAAMLKIKTPRGETRSVILPASEVFEDRTPRLADLDGDGTVEVITIRSSITAGASVTIYGLSGDVLVQKASTGFYGQPNRWLNIAAIAPFLGTRQNEIAFVQTPHIGGTLFVYKYFKGKFFKIDAMRGFSNHVIGSREMRLSAIADFDISKRLELAVPSADRRSLRIVEFKKEGLREIGSAILPSPIDKAIGISIDNNKGYVVGLENGEVYRVYK